MLAKASHRFRMSMTQPAHITQHLFAKLILSIITQSLARFLIGSPSLGCHARLFLIGEQRHQRARCSRFFDLFLSCQQSVEYLRNFRVQVGSFVACQKLLNGFINAKHPLPNAREVFLQLNARCFASKQILLKALSKGFVRFFSAFCWHHAPLVHLVVNITLDACKLLKHGRHTHGKLLLTFS